MFPPCQGVITFDVEYTVGACQACTCSGNCSDCKMVNLIAKVMVNGVEKDPGQCGWDISWSSSPNWCSVTNPNSLTPSMNYRLCDLTPNGNNFSANVKLTLLIPDEDPVNISKTVIFLPCQPPPPVCNPMRPDYKPFTKCIPTGQPGGTLASTCQGAIACGASGTGPDPAPTTINITCDIGSDVESYLARQVEAKNLWELVCKTNLGGDLATYDYTTMPPTLLRSEECAFCEQLSLLVDLKATMLTYASQYWTGNLLYMSAVTDPKDEYSYMPIFGRMVASINYAFDCAGLRRPVIQGGIWEAMSHSVCKVEITPCVINHFYDEIIAAGQESIDRYLGQSPVHFNHRYICKADPPFICTGECDPTTYPATCDDRGPDFSKLEARMWYYHMGTMLIDAGFTSILIGNGDLQGASPGGTDLTNFYQTAIVNDLRDYAASLSPPTDLIMKLESEPSHKYANVGGILSSDQILADYSDLSLRPREVFLDGNGSPINMGGLNDRNTTRPGCEGSGEYIPAELFGPECNGQPYLAFFDICHSGGYKHAESQIGGVTAHGCPTENLPRVYVWDSGPDCYTDFDGPPIPPGQYYALRDNDPSDNNPCDLENLQNCVNSWNPSHYSVWGWDEAAWWAVGFKPILQGATADPKTGIVAIDMAALDNDACRLEWLKKTTVAIRNSTPDGNSFLVMKTFGKQGTKDPCKNTITETIPFLDLSDPAQHPDLQQGQLAALWEPIPVTENSIGIEEGGCIEMERDGPSCGIGCGNLHLDHFGKSYTFFVEEPDLTSLYQIKVEILGASGQVVSELSGFSYALKKTLAIGNLQPGEKVKVTLRQYNNGIAANNGIIVKEKLFESLGPCCSEIEEIPVAVLRHHNCWLELAIPYNVSAGVSQFYWTTYPPADIIPANVKASRVWVNLYGLNSPDIAFCVAGLDVGGAVKTGGGDVELTNSCGSKGLVISPVPNPISQNQTLTVLLSGDLMDEVQTNNTPLTLNFVRAVDGFMVKNLTTAQEVNQLDILDFQEGLHWIVTSYNGVTYSASFVVENP